MTSAIPDGNGGILQTTVVTAETDKFRIARGFACYCTGVLLRIALIELHGNSIDQVRMH